MKTFILISALLASASSFATDFSVKIEDIRCTISNDQVTRVEKVGPASFTEKKTVSITGIDSLVKKVATVSSELPANSKDEYIFEMTHEGKTYTLNMDDSKESMILVRFLSKICL